MRPVPERGGRLQPGGPPRAPAGRGGRRAEGEDSGRAAPSPRRRLREAQSRKSERKTKEAPVLSSELTQSAAAFASPASRSGGRASTLHMLRLRPLPTHLLFRLQNKIVDQCEKLQLQSAAIAKYVAEVLPEKERQLVVILKSRGGGGSSRPAETAVQLVSCL